MRSIFRRIKFLGIASYFFVGISDVSIATVIVDPDAFKEYMPIVNKALLENKSTGEEIQGICGHSKSCTIGINGESILTSSGDYIKADNVIAWTMTNASSKGGVLFVSNNEDYRFLIKYFDSSGKRKIAKIGFLNFKTAQTFLSHLELVVGLAPNHDQAGATTLCNARGKDIFSGTTTDNVKYIDKQGFGASSYRNSVYGGVAGGAAGALVGSALSGGSTAAVNTGLVAGGVIGALSGDSLGRASGSLSLKRNIVSEVRKTPSKASAFIDRSFDHRSHCVDEPLNTTNVNVKSHIPLKIQDSK